MNWPRITFIGLLMGGIQWLAARNGFGQIAALLASVTGVALIATMEQGRRRHVRDCGS